MWLWKKRNDDTKSYCVSNIEMPQYVQYKRSRWDVSLSSSHHNNVTSSYVWKMQAYCWMYHSGIRFLAYGIRGKKLNMGWSLRADITHMKIKTQNSWGKYPTSWVIRISFEIMLFVSRHIICYMPIGKGWTLGLIYGKFRIRKLLDDFRIFFQNDDSWFL